MDTTPHLGLNLPSPLSETEDWPAAILANFARLDGLAAMLELDFNGVNQTVPANSDTDIAFTHKPYDDNGWYNATTGKLQPTEPCVLDVRFSCFISGSGLSASARAQLYFNGTPRARGCNANGLYSSTLSRSSVARRIAFNGSTDYLTFNMDVPSGATFLSGDIAETWASVARVR